MEPLRTFTIIPALPPKLQLLKEIAYNLQWTWNHEAIDLFHRIDRDLWEDTNHNPVKLLGQIRQERLEALAEDESFLAYLNYVSKNLETYLKEPTWYQKIYGNTNHDVKIAYFSTEFGLTECMPNYSGGLGVLSGDHLKSASDLGLPLIGIGMLYQEGYFNQYLNADGWQGESYPKNDFYNMPIQLQKDEADSPLIIEIDFPGRKVYAQIWKVEIGHVNLFLLDTNISLNNEVDRDITDELYGGDAETRIQQEIILGIGGMRALKALGIKPTVFHMNEGHSAFLALERIRCAIEDHNLSFDEAKELTRSSNIFTTHTPVPAGIDRFSPQLIERYFSNYFPLLKINKNEFLALGRQNPHDGNESFSMAVLAIKLSSHINAVSKLHAQVTKEMWHDMWRQIPASEIPIASITNGIHSSSWISKEMANLYDRYLSPTWRRKPADMTIWKRVEQIPAEELWRTHERRRERLVAYARTSLRKQLERQGALPSEIKKADEILDPEALTIVFARRFATYKRATLILQNSERLKQIVNNKEWPVQIIFAGKAHPKDTPGKEYIRKIIHLARLDEFRQSMVFLEDYDMAMSRYLVQGADVWLNTPRRPNEASGTSGMKAAVNGVLNVSVLDGWWDEAYNPNVGWAIGSGEEYEDTNYQDEVESQSFYNLLEKEIIPLFYDRGKNNIPRKWIELMKQSMTQICPIFNTNRMVKDYVEKVYLPAEKKYRTLFKQNQKRTKELTAWKAQLFNNWPNIRFISVKENGIRQHFVGSKIELEAKIFLGNLRPDDVNVEAYHGYVDADNEIVNGTVETMTHTEQNEDQIHTFSGNFSCLASGLYGYTVRITPKNECLTLPHETGLILWANV